LGRLDEGVSLARKAVPVAERIGHWGCSLFCKWNIDEARLAAGDFGWVAESASLLEEYERLHYIPWNVVGKVTLANVARLRGRVDEAVEWCRQVSLPERNHWGGYVHAALALIFAQSGDSRVSQALKDAMPFVPRAGHPAPFGRWPTLNLVIEALAGAGRREDAAALHPAAEDMIGAGWVLMLGGMLHRTSAGIAAACASHWPRAEEHHQIGIHQADTLPHKIAQPIARYWYAEMLRARNHPGDDQRARDLLSEALAMCESLGMPLYARQASERLTELSKRGLPQGGSVREFR